MPSTHWTRTPSINRTVKHDSPRARRRERRVRRRLRMERLEERVLLAGDLTLNGSPILPNDLILERVSATQLRLRSADGLIADQTFEQPDSLTIQLGPFNDTLTIADGVGTFPGALTIDGGLLSDTVRFDGDIDFDGHNLSIAAEVIEVAGAAVSTRPLAGGDAGEIRFQGQTIDIQTGSQLLADVPDGGGNAGTISLAAEVSDFSGISPVDFLPSSSPNPTITIHPGAEIRGGEISLTAAKQSQTAVLPLTILGLQANVAAISIDGAALHGDEITIDASAGDDNILEGDDVVVANNLGIQPALGLIANLAQLPTALTAASVVIRSADASVSLNDARIVSSGGVSITSATNVESEAEAGGGLDPTRRGLGSTLATNWPLAVGYSQADGAAETSIRGATVIDAGGDVTISTDAQTKAVTAAATFINSGPRPSRGGAAAQTVRSELSFGLSVGIANSTTTSRATVGPDATIQAAGTVTVQAGGNVKNEADSRTAIFLDGPFGTAVSVGVDKADIEASVEGRITAQAVTTLEDRDVPLPLAAVDPLNDTITLPDHGLEPGQEMIYAIPKDPADSSRTLEAIGGLVDGELLRVAVVDDNTIQLTRSAGIPLDATRVSRVNPDSVQTLSPRALLSFTPAFDVNEVANTIRFAEPHGLQNAQPVEYFLGNAHAEPIPGLVNEDPYFVHRLSDTEIQLLTDDPENPASADQPPIRIGVADYYVIDLGQPTVTQSAVTFDPTGNTPGSNAVVYPDLDILAFETDHRFATGQKVTYTSDGDPVGGLADGDYYAIRVDRAQLRLAASPSDASEGKAIDLDDSPASGTAHRLSSLHSHLLAFEQSSLSFRPADAVDQDGLGSTIQFGAPHGLRTGDAVVYRTDPEFQQKAPVTVISQIPIGGSSIRFDPTGNMSGELPDLDPDPILDADADTISLDAIHDLVTGQRVTYSSGGGAAIGGLIDGHDYFVVADPSAPNLLQLAETREDALAAVVIDLGGGASGTEHQLHTQAVDSADDILVVPSHGFHTGQRLHYVAGGANPIGGLADNGEYFAIRLTENLLQLAASREDAASGAGLDLAGGATGDRHNLVSTVAVTRFDTSRSQPVVDVDGDTIELPEGHDLNVDDLVIYNRGDGRPVGGLVDGQGYQIASVAGRRVTLNDLEGNPVDLQPGATVGFTPHALIRGESVFAFNPTQRPIVDEANDTLWMPGHRFEDGETVTYLPAGEMPLGGLTPNASYVVLRDPASPDTIQLADPAAPTVPLPLSSGGATGFQGLEQQAAATIFDPVIDGLGNNELYYVIRVDDTSIRLTNSPLLASASGPIDLELSADQEARKAELVHALNTTSEATPGINVLAGLESENTAIADTGIGRLPTIGDFIAGDVGQDPKTAKAILAGSSKFLKVSRKTAFSLSASVGVNAFQHDVLARVGGGADLDSDADVTIQAKAEPKAGVNVKGSVTTENLNRAEVSDTSSFAGAIAVAVGAYGTKAEAIVENGAAVDARRTLSVLSEVEYGLMVEELPFHPQRFDISSQDEGNIPEELGAIFGGTGGLTQAMNLWASTSGRTPKAEVTITGSVGISDYVNLSQAVIGAGAMINQDPRYHDPGQSVVVDARTTMASINVGGVLHAELSEQGVRNLLKGSAAGRRSSPISLFGNQAKSVGIGGTVLSQSVANTTVARVDSKARVRTGIDGQLDVTATESIYSFEFAQTGGDSGKVGVSGSVSYVTHRGETLAHVASGVVAVGGPLTIQADSNVEVVNLIGAVQAAREVGIGASVGITSVDRQTLAFIGNRRTEEDTPAGNDGTSIEAARLTVDAAAGGRIWGVGVAGAVVSDLAGADSFDSTAPPPTPNVSIGVSGVGLSQQVVDVTQAYVHDNGNLATGFARVMDGGNETKVPFGDGGMEVTSRNSTGIFGVAGAASVAFDKAPATGSKTAVGVAGAFARNFLDLTTEAFLVGVHVLETPSLTVHASTDEARVFGITVGVSVAAALANGTAASAAAAGSVSVNLVEGQVRAYLEDVRLRAAGDVSITSVDTTRIDAVTIGGAGAGSSSTGGAGGSGALGGAVALNFVDVVVASFITDSQEGVVAEGSIELAATSDTRILGVGGGFAVAVGIGAGATGVAASGSIGAGVAINEIGARGGHSTQAYIDNSLVEAGEDVRLNANSTAVIQALALGGAGAGAGSSGTGFTGAFSGAGAGTGNGIQGEILALIRNGSDVTAGADVLLAAEDASQITATSGAFSLAIAASTGAGATATGSLGVSIAANQISNTTRAAIESNSLVNAGGIIDVRAHADSTVDRTLEFQKTAVNNAARAIRVDNHGLLTGDLVRYVSSAGTPLDGLVSGESYYVVRVDAHHIQLVATKADSAEDEPPALGISGSGAGNDHRLDLLKPRIKGLAIGGVGAGSGSGGTGLTLALAGAGAGVVNQINNQVEAIVDGGTRPDGSAGVVAAGNVTVSASDASTILADAGGVAVAVSINTGGGADFTGAGSVGIGTAINEIGLLSGHEVRAAIESDVFAGGDIRVTAESTTVIDALAIGGAGAGSGSSGTGFTGAIAAGGAGAGNTIRQTIEAAVRDGAVTADSGSVRVLATDRSQIQVDAGGVAASAAIGLGAGAAGSLSIGAAIVVNKVDNTTRAVVADANVVAQQDIEIEARSTSVITSFALGAAAAVSVSAGGGVAGSGAAAGSFSTNEVHNLVEALASGNATLDTRLESRAGSVRVAATDDAEISAVGIGGSIAISGSPPNGVSVSVAIALVNADNTIGTETRASAEHAVILTPAGDVQVDAASTSDIQSTAVAASLNVSISVASFGFSGGGARAENSVGNTIEATLQSADVDSLNDVHVAARDHAMVESFTGAFALSVGVVGASVGASINLNEVNNTVLASADGSITVLAGNLNVDAHSAVVSDALGVVTSVAVSGVGLAGAGGETTSTIGGSVAAEVTSGTNVRANHVRVVAESEQDATADISSVAVSVGAGAALAVGVSLGEALINGTTRASLGGTVDADSLLVDATSDSTAGSTTVAVAGGIGLFGGAGSGNRAQATVSPTVLAYLRDADVGSEADPLAGDVTVRAVALTDADAKATGATFATGVAVGIARTNVLVSPKISAYVGGDSQVVADGSVILQSLHNYLDDNGSLVRQDKQSRADVTSGSGGLLNGDAGAVGNAGAVPDLHTYVETDAVIQARGDVLVLSQSYTDVDASAESTAVGITGIGVAEAFANADGSIRAGVDGTVVAGDDGGDRYANLAVAWHRANADARAFTIALGGAGATSRAIVQPVIQAQVGAGADIQAAGDAFTLAIAETSAAPTAQAAAIIPINNTGDGARSNPSLSVDIGANARLVAGGGNALQTFVDQSVVPDTIPARDLAPNALASLGNVAPLITSPDQANVVEGNTAVLTIEASDEDGDPLQLAIAGGADADSFTLDAGSLRFVRPPVFQTGPEADNQYEVVIKAADNRGGADSQTITVNVLQASFIRLVPGAQPVEGNVDSGAVSLDQVLTTAAAAVERWTASGLSPEQADRLQAVTYQVGDLSEGHIAAATGLSVTIDRDANTYGWFVDATPLVDEEYRADNSTAWFASGGEAAGGIDLLTVLMHELGHVIGLADVTEPDDLMYQFVDEGQRRVPAGAQAVGAALELDSGETHFVTSGDFGDHDSLRNRGANYARRVADEPGAGFTGPVNTVTVAASVEPDIRINLGTGSELQSGSSDDVVIRVESNHIVRAVGGGLDGIPTPIGVVDAQASIGGSVEVFLGGTITHGGSLTLELHTMNQAVAIGEALAVGPLGGTAVQASATVTPTIATYVSPGSRVTVAGDFAIRTLSEGSAVAEARGIAGSAGFSVGLSKAEASFTPTISTYVGEGASIEAGGSITVETLHNYDASGNPLDRPTKATAEASAGSLVGVSGAGALAQAENSPTVTAFVDDGASLHAGPAGTVTIRALANNPADAVAQGLAVVGVGYGAVGATSAEAESSGTTQAWLAGDVSQTGDLVIRSQSRDRADALSVATSGGLLAGFTGAASRAEATASPTVSAWIDNARAVTADGGVTVESVAWADAEGEAKGVDAGAGAVGIGLSWAESTLSPNIDTFVADGAAVDAGGDILVRSRMNTTAGGVSSTTHGAKSTAGASTGAKLVGGGGAKADAVASPRVDTYVGDNASLAGRDVQVRTLASTRGETEIDADINGIFTVGATDAALDIDAHAKTEIRPGARVRASRDATVDTRSAVAIDAMVEGGAGSRLSDFFKDLFSGNISALSLPTIASVAGSSLDIEIENQANTTIAGGASVVAQGAADIRAWSRVVVESANTMRTGGAVANSATSGTQVFIDSDAAIDLGVGAQVRGRTVTIDADNRIDAEAVAEAIAAVDVEGAFATALSRLDVGSGSDPSQALVHIDRGAVIDAADSLTIDATNRRATGGSGANLVANPKSQADANGLIGVALAHADGNVFVESAVVGEATSDFITTDLNVHAESSHALLRKPETVSETLVTKVLEVVREVTNFIEEEICEWLPWPLGTLCETVTTAVTSLVTVLEEVTVGLETFPTTGGQGLVSEDTIHLNGDVTVNQPVGGTLIVNADGSIDPASNVTATVTASEVQVGQIAPTSPVTLTFLVPRGVLQGSPNININNVADLSVENRSDRDLVFGDLNSAGAGPAPDLRFRFDSGERYQVNTESVATNSLDVRNVGGGDVVFTAPISSPGGSFDIVNTGGGIRAAGDDVYLEVGDAGHLNLSSEGPIGSPDLPFQVRLLRGKYLPDGSLSNREAELIAHSNRSVFVDVTGILNPFDPESSDAIDPSELVNGIALNLAARDDIDLTISGSLVLEITPVTTSTADGVELDFEQVYHPTTGTYRILNAVAETGDVTIAAPNESLEIGFLTRPVGWHPMNVALPRGTVRATSGTVTLDAGGSITDGNVNEATDVVAGQINLHSTSGAIGQASNPLDIDVTGSAPLRASGEAGVWLNETAGGIRIDEVHSTTGPVVLTTIDRFSSGQDIVLPAGASVRSDAASVTLRAGDDLRLDAGGSVQAADAISLIGDFGDADILGSRIDVDVQTIAESLAISTGNDADTIRLTNPAHDTSTSIATGDGNDTVSIILAPATITLDGGGGQDFVSAALDRSPAAVAAASGTALLTTQRVESVVFNHSDAAAVNWDLDGGMLSGNQVALLDAATTGLLHVTLGPSGGHSLRVGRIGQQTEVTVPGDANAVRVGGSLATLADIAAPLALRATGTRNTLVLDDTGSPAGVSLTSTLTSGRFSGPNSAGELTYDPAAFTSIDVSLGAANDDLTLRDAGAVQQILGGAGQDQFTVSGEVQIAALHGGQGPDRLLVEEGTGSVAFFGEAGGGDSLDVNRASAVTALAARYEVDRTNGTARLLVEGAPDVALAYPSDTETITVQLGAGNDTFALPELRLDTQLLILGGAGDDKVDVTLTPGSGETVSAGGLSVFGDGGEDTVNIELQGNPPELVSPHNPLERLTLSVETLLIDNRTNTLGGTWSHVDANEIRYDGALITNALGAETTFIQAGSGGDGLRVENNLGGPWKVDVEQGSVRMQERDVLLNAIDFDTELSVGVQEVKGLVASPDGNYVLGISPSTDRVVVYTRAADGTLSPASTYSGPETASVSGVAISPSGNHVYVTSPTNNSVSVYDLVDGTLTLRQTVVDDTTSNGRFVSALGGANGVAVTPDGSQVVVTAPNETNSQDDAVDKVGVFSRNSTTGELTFSIEHFFDSGSQLREIVAAPDPTSSLSVFLAAAPGTNLVEVRNVERNGYVVNRLGAAQPAGIATSANGKHAYVANRGDGSIRVYEGRICTFCSAGFIVRYFDVESVTVEGVTDLATVAVSPDGQYVVAAATDDGALLAFRRNASNGRLTFVDQLTAGRFGGVGLSDPLSVTFSPDSRHVYVGSAGDSRLPGGIATYELLTPNSEPRDYRVHYTGIDDGETLGLDVTVGDGNDVVSVAALDQRLRLDTGGGGDAVALQQVRSGDRVQTGAGDDNLTIVGTRSGSQSVASGGPGSDRFEVLSVDTGSRLELLGGDGADSFFIDGSQLAASAEVVILGGQPGSDPGDKLEFYAPQGSVTNPLGPRTPDDQVTIADNGATGTVSYSEIEDYTRLGTAARADAGPDYTIREGESLQLDASGSEVFGTPTPVPFYDWDLNGDGVFDDATGVAPSLTWTQLSDLGLGDGDRTYNVALRMTTDTGDLSFDSAALLINNAAPLLTLTGADTAPLGGEYVLGFSASDPGDDRITAWRVDWGDGTIVELGSGALAASHVYDSSPGTFEISLTAIDEDGEHAASKSITVAPDASSVQAGGPYSVLEGQDLALHATAIGSPARYEWDVDGDGDADFTSAGGSLPLAWNDLETLGLNGDQTVSNLTVTAVYDVAGGEQAGTSPPTTLAVGNVPPEGVLTVNVTDVDEGSPTGSVRIEVTNLSDPSSRDTNNGFTFQFDFDNDGTFDTSASSVPRADVPAEYLVKNGPLIMRARVRDDAGHTDLFTGIDVRDVLPTLILAPDAETASEGSPLNLNLSVSDPGGDAVLEWLVNWGDDTSESFAGTTKQVAHVFSDGSPEGTARTITVTARMAEGNVTDTTQVTVIDAAPTVTLATTTPVVPEGARDAFALDITVTDPGRDTVGGLLVDWGDGRQEFVRGSATRVTHTYENAGAYGVRILELTNEDGTFLEPSNVLSVTVDDVIPSIALDQVAVPVEGLAASPIDLRAVAVGTETGAEPLSFTWTVTRPDGSSFQLSGQGQPLLAAATAGSGGGQTYFNQTSFTPLSSGTYSLKLEIADDDGTGSDDTTATFEVVVMNADPILTVDATAVVMEEGASVSRPVLVFDIPPEAVQVTASIGVVSGSGSSWMWSYEADDDLATTPVVITARDGEGGEATAAFNLTVNNADPVVIMDTRPVVLTEGNTASRTIVTADVPADTVGVTASLGTISGSGNNWTWSYNGTDDLPTTPVVITASDGDGGETTATFDLTVLNADPVLNVDVTPVVLNPGDSAGKEMATLDVPSDTVSVTASLGTITGSGNNWTWHYEASGALPTTSVSITAADEDGGMATAAFDLTVLVPSVTITSSATTEVRAAVGETVEIRGVLSDFVNLDRYTAVIEWGDGSRNAATIDPDASTLLGQHVYATGGLFEIVVRLTHPSGSEVTGTTTAFVAGTRLTEDGVLQVVGTNESDFISASPSSVRIARSAGLFRFDTIVRENFDPNDVVRVEVSGGDGNDFILIARRTDVPVILDGGPGDDWLRGGNSTNLLLGGPGDDLLMGGPRRDILIGGAGGDLLLGYAGEDVLAGVGVENTQDELLPVWDEWNAEQPFADREQNVRRNLRLVPDASRNLLLDGPDQDVLLDVEGGEAARTLPAVNSPATKSLSLHTFPGGMPFTFAPLSTFADVPGAAGGLRLTASLADGSELPDWLAFDAATGTFRGSPSWSLGAILEVQMTAADPATPHLTSDVSFLLMISPNDTPWQNASNRYDVNGADGVTPHDVLAVVNHLNQNRAGRLPDPPSGLLQPPFHDVNGDGHATPADALMVINYLNAAGVAANAEGEAGGREATTPVEVPPLQDHGRPNPPTVVFEPAPTLWQWSAAAGTCRPLPLEVPPNSWLGNPKASKALEEVFDDAWLSEQREDELLETLAADVAREWL